MTLKELVTKDNIVQFVKYFDGQLWYAVRKPDPLGDDAFSNSLFDFPVPILDIGNATFLAEDKSIFFMRYIRNHLNMLEKAKEENK